VVVAQLEVNFSGGTEEKHNSLSPGWPRFQPDMSQIKTKTVMLKPICSEDQYEE
jgi:hypothetical protein